MHRAGATCRQPGCMPSNNRTSLMIFQYRARCATPRVLTVGFHLLLLVWAQPGAAQSAKAGTASVLPSIEVTGIADDNGLVPQWTRSATRTDEPIGEIPLSVSVVTREQMDAQNVHSINQAFRYAPGIATELSGGSTAFDHLTIRGLTGESGSSDSFLDGLRQTEGPFYGAQQVDPFLLERMEVLRGPASVLYGMALPGGVLALTSKLPRDESIRLAVLEGGSRGNRRASFDIGGRADQDGVWLYRIAGTAWNSDGLADGAPVRRRAVAPSFTWQPSAATRLTLYARYQDDPALGNYGTIPAEGSVLSNPHGRLPAYLNLGEPGYNTFSRRQRVTGYHFDQRLNDSWSISSSGRYSDIDAHRAVVTTGMLQADQRTVNRSTSVSDTAYHVLILDNQLRGRVVTGAARHELLAGVSWERTGARGNYAGGMAPPLDMYRPVYGAAIGAPMVYTDNRVHSVNTGLYFQDQVALGNWHTTGGVRYDHSTIGTDDMLGRGGSFKQYDHAVTSRIGTLYRFNNGVAPYATYAQSFRPTNELSASGTPFKPSRGELFETGLKYQPENGDVLLTAALFQLTQDNLLRYDPANQPFKLQGGELRSRGLELEARAKLGRQWSVIAAYTWQHVQYTKGDPDNIGKTPSRVPERFGGVWLAWDAPSGLGAALGVRHNGGSWVGDATLENYRTPAFTLLDAQVHYDFGRQSAALKGARMQLNVSNLTGKRYVASCYDPGWGGCFAGQERQVNLTFAYQW